MHNSGEVNQPAKVVRLVLPQEPGPALATIGRVFAGQVQRRCEARVATEGSAPLTVELAVEPGIGAEGYRIMDRQTGGVRIVGNDERGVLYGVGKFLRESRYDKGGFTPGAWRGTSVPKCPVRMVYLATHFQNFYEAAPIEEVAHYVQDLGLWGYNAIGIHFPAWQFDGFADPAAQVWLKRFKTVFQEARACGLQVGLLQDPNDAWKNRPDHLRKTDVPGHRRGNFGANLCPSKPEAWGLLMELYDGLLDEFREGGLDYFVFWPYDEGGCACKDCWPWGARGFVKLSKELAAHIRQRFPECKRILSTWCFENEDDNNPDGEWIGLTNELAKDRSWVEYLMADGHDDYFPAFPLQEGVPGRLPLLNFPEISMFGMGPWGGYGTNPAPAHFQMLWDRIKHTAAGGAPYSEGIYEDINKAIVAGFYWDPERRAMDTVREYVSFEFSPDVADELVQVVRIFEQNHTRESIGESAVRALELVRKAEAKLTAQVRASWRWRIFALRALIDKELFERQGRREGAALKAAFAELTRLYHAEHAHSMPIKPPEIV